MTTHGGGHRQGLIPGDGPTEREMGLQVRMRQEESGQGVTHQQQGEGKKTGKRNVKTDAFPQRERETSQWKKCPKARDCCKPFNVPKEGNLAHPKAEQVTIN